MLYFLDGVSITVVVMEYIYFALLLEKGPPGSEQSPIVAVAGVCPPISISWLRGYEGRVEDGIFLL